MPFASIDPWTTPSLNARLEWLARFRATLDAQQDRLIDLIVAETHKPRHEALLGDLMPLLASCRWHERHARRLLTARRIAGRPLLFMGQSHRVERVPLGRVAIIATWNYPVQLLGIQLVQAIVAGNRVIVKPSEHAPMTQSFLLQLAVASGLPPGTLEWTDASREAGPKLLSSGADGSIDHVVFTGSTAVGREIATWAARHLIPTTLELSGCDSAIVLADADPLLAARTIWSGVTMNGGQTCMAPRRALVERSIYHAFVNALAPLASGAKPRRLITEEAAIHAGRLVGSAVAAGGRSLSGVLEPVRGSVITPIAVVDCPAEAELVAGNHFAPVLAVVPVDTGRDALKLHRLGSQHLATSIFTRHPERLAPMLGELNTGFVTVNDCLLPQAHPATSIAGTGQSGWGPSRGEAGLLAMTRAVHFSSTSPRIRPPTDPPTAKTLAMLRRTIHWLYGRGTPAVVSEPPPNPPASSPAQTAHHTQSTR
jgi:acyl-CoA reductase-like NAD-dependent aldehyde dehydrogenase